MWKIIVGFLLFAAVALYLLSKGGDIDMSGEKHGLVNSTEHHAWGKPLAQDVISDIYVIRKIKVASLM